MNKIYFERPFGYEDKVYIAYNGDVEKLKDVAEKRFEYKCIIDADVIIYKNTVVIIESGLDWLKLKAIKVKLNNKFGFNGIIKNEINIEEIGDLYIYNNDKLMKALLMPCRAGRLLFYLGKDEDWEIHKFPILFDVQTPFSELCESEEVTMKAIVMR